MSDTSTAREALECAALEYSRGHVLSAAESIGLVRHLLASGLVVTAAEHDRRVAEKAWDEGYKDRGGVVVDIYGDVTETRENPYRSTASQGIQEESKA